MTTATAVETTATVEENHFLAPRPGRSRCDAVTSYECLAPAGYRTSSGAASVPGVRRADLHTCAYCGEPVCQNCSTSYGDLGRACDSHNEHELLDWINAWTKRRGNR